MSAGSWYWSEVANRVRAWWDASTFIGDVALVFTVVTVGNSAMMLTGLDEPKTGAFAYVHLLGRLGIITVLVGLFHLDEVRGRRTRWRHHGPHRGPGRPRHSMRSVLNSIGVALLRSGLEGTTRLYAATVAATSVTVLALAEIWPPAGGHGLYRNLVLLGLLLAPAMYITSHWWQHRTPTPVTEQD